MRRVRLLVGCSSHVARLKQHGTAPRRVITAASQSYSRSSWRSAIIEEQGGQEQQQQQQQHYQQQATIDGAAGRTGGSQSSLQAGSSSRTDSRGQGGVGDHLADHEDVLSGLSAAELRVKLSLAAGSGRLDLTDARLSELPAEVAQLTELEVRGGCKYQSKLNQNLGEP